MNRPFPSFLSVFVATLFAAVLTLGLPTAASALTGSIVVPNASFEIPAETNVVYGPTGGQWVFTPETVVDGAPNGSGIALDGVGFTASTPLPPQGKQVAFIVGSGTISQPLSGFIANTPYVITFYAVQIPNNHQSIQVSVDSSVLGDYEPQGAAYTLFRTASFTVAAGTHTIKFRGLNTTEGNDISLMDNVSVLPAQPEISTINPNTIPVGQSAFILAVNGAGFTPTMVVQANGGTLQTTYFNSTELGAAVPSKAGDKIAHIDIQVADLASTAISNIVPLHVTQTTLDVTIGQMRRTATGTILITVPIMLTNTGFNSAPDLEIISATLNGVASSTSMPISLGSLAAYFPASFLATFPGSVGVSHASATLELQGSYTGGSFDTLVPLSLP